MIKSLANHVTPNPTSTATPIQRPARSTSSSADFRKLLHPAATTTPTTASTTLTSSSDPPRLGPFTGDLNTHPAVAPPKAPDPITSSPWLPPGTAGDQNLMNRTEHEATMNTWLQNYTKWSNDNKTQIYQQAMVNWQLNSQRCQELGLPAPEQPKPPTLDPVQPMPAGWWFNT